MASETEQREAPAVVEVDHVTMVFNIASESLGSLKEYAIKIARRELMFKEFKALEDISFTVEQGDVFGLLGTNGSGKSTMLKIVAGVLEPTEGKCIVRGSIAPLIELGAGFDMELSARENIYLNGALLGYSKKFIEDHFDSIVEFADVGDFLDMPMKNYSSGMVARIAFAIATEVVPDILIVDEVLSVGDFMFQQKCERRIRSLIEDHGVTVLIVSHDSGLIERLCNKAIWIEKGHTQICGSAKEVCSLYRLLGGHEGSDDSAARVKEIFESEVDVSAKSYTTLLSENRYSSAAMLAENVLSERGAGGAGGAGGVGGAGGAGGVGDAGDPSGVERIVVAPGESEQLSFVANSLAGMLGTVALLAREDYVPDSTRRILRQCAPKEVVLIESPEWKDSNTADELASEIDGNVTVLSAESLNDLAISAYNYGLGVESASWSKTALLTHTDYIADRISLSPFTYAEKVPAFFNVSDGVIDERVVQAILDAGCMRLLVAGGTVSFPDECLDVFASRGIAIDRFCYKDGYEASVSIAKWVLENGDGFSLAQPVIASFLSPANAFCVGAYAASGGRVVLIEDPHNLDSVVSTYDFLHEHKSQVERLVFLGDSDTYSTTDKTLLAKAVS